MLSAESAPPSEKGNPTGLSRPPVSRKISTESGGLHKFGEPPIRRGIKVGRTYIYNVDAEDQGPQSRKDRPRHVPHGEKDLQPEDFGQVSNRLKDSESKSPLITNLSLRSLSPYLSFWRWGRGSKRTFDDRADAYRMQLLYEHLKRVVHSSFSDYSLITGDRRPRIEERCIRFFLCQICRASKLIIRVRKNGRKFFSKTNVRSRECINERRKPLHVVSDFQTKKDTVSELKANERNRLP